MEYYSIVMPLQLKNDIELIIRPFATEVWICSLTVIPIFIVSMGLANYLFYGIVRWDTVSGFALRIVFVESADKLNVKCIYQKIYTIVWIWSFFVLAKSYAGEDLYSGLQACSTR